MKKLIIKIGNETHELPYNGEAFSFEVSEKYVPKVGDCVKVECINPNKTSSYWFKVKEFTNANVDFSLTIGEYLDISKNGFFNISNNRVYTKITPEELKAKYAEGGYNWDYDTDTIKPLKWTPKDGDKVWYLLDDFTIVNGFYNENLYYLLEKDLLFKTEEECKKFSKYCLSYFNNKKE